VRVLAIDLHFLKYGKLSSEFAPQVEFDFLGRAWFPVVELVAGEGKDLETFVFELIIQLDQLDEVHLRHASL